MNDMKRSVKKTTSMQFEVLKHEMAIHPLAAIGYGVGAERIKIDAEWKGIVEKLNAIGPPFRTMTEWKKVWSDVRLRIKKRLSVDCSRRSRKKEESESEEDLLMEALNSSNSIYASQSCPDNDDFDNGRIEQESSSPIAPPHIDSDDYAAPSVVIENNPLDEEEFPDIDNKNNIKLNKHVRTSTTNESQYNGDGNSNFAEHTLYTLQSQMEQHNKLLENLSRISSSLSTLMERNVTAMERRTKVIERQARATEYHNFLLRRQEARKKLKTTTFQWF